MTTGGPDLRVEQVDPGQEGALRRWWETGRDCWVADRVVPDWPAWEVSRRELPAYNPELETIIFLAHDHADPGGFGMLVLPVRDNPHLALLDLGVLPGHRRRGHGTTLARALQHRALERGRTTIVAEGTRRLGEQRRASSWRRRWATSWPTWRP